jgi:hypothetical protein
MVYSGAHAEPGQGGVMKARWVWLVVTIACVLGTTDFARAAEYRLEGSVAAYRWVEKLGLSGISDPEEFGPVLQLGGYVSGFPTSVANLSLRGDVRLLVGRVQYDTYNQFQNSFGQIVLVPLDTHTSYIGSTQEGSAGYRQGIDGGYIEPFVGLGYRWWWRDLSGETGYPEYYRIVYGRVGVRTEHSFESPMKLRTAFSLELPFSSRETIDFSDSSYNDPSFGDVLVVGQRFSVEHGLRPGWTIEVGLRQANIDVTGYWQAVRLDESNSALGFDSTNPLARRFFRQPKSHQDILGLRLGVAF